MGIYVCQNLKWIRFVVHKLYLHDADVRRKVK